MMNRPFLTLPTRFPLSTASAPPSYLNRMTDSPSIRDVLDFWFLPLSDPEHGKPREIWWKGPAEFDTEVRDRFGAAFDRAVDGVFDSWRQSPDGALAHIVLCDQFPRNMHRKTARAFAGDGKALETARLGLGGVFSAGLRGRRQGAGNGAAGAGAILSGGLQPHDANLLLHAVPAQRGAQRPGTGL